MPLSCGGKGPCCHVGYSHRHCEHCDLVIDTRQYVAPYVPWWQSGYPYWQYPLVAPFQYTSFVTSGYIQQNNAVAMSVNHACAALPPGD